MQARDRRHPDGGDQSPHGGSACCRIRDRKPGDDLCNIVFVVSAAGPMLTTVPGADLVSYGSREQRYAAQRRELCQWSA
jgi:hypothetical protein